MTTASLDFLRPRRARRGALSKDAGFAEFASANIRAGGIAFKEANEHFRNKIRLPVKTYRDLAGECHAKAFMIAGADNDALLADFQAAIRKYMDSGASTATFREDFDKIVAARGWQYHGKPGWRSSVIINTNMRTSYMAGRWQKLWDEREARPYLLYQQVQRPGRRPEHAQWHNLILPIGHPFWTTHYPPNGWG